MGHRGQFCYVSAVLPGHREPTPILRLRYQGSAGRWATGIYLASTGQYTESELPATFGPATGTPEQGVDDTFASTRVLNLIADGAQPAPGQTAAKVRNTRRSRPGCSLSSSISDSTSPAWIVSTSAWASGALLDSLSPCSP